MALINRLQVLARANKTFYPALARLYSSDEGAIRESGGAFSKREKAQEDQYFRRLQQEQMAKLKQQAEDHHQEEIDHHADAIKELERQIRRHKEKIERHKRRLEDDD